ncbi:MAG TPA: GGDEF domain-containing protein, partial [Candidatus Elarobacter sp.]
AVCALFAVLRARGRERAAAVAARAARAREEATAEAARRILEAARTGTESVLATLGATIRTAVAAIDAIAVYEEADGVLTCVFADGDRIAYYAGSQTALGDPASPAARAIAVGRRVRLGDGGAALHPADGDLVAVPLACNPGRSCAVVACARSVLSAVAVERIVAFAELTSPAYAIARERDDDRRRAEYDGLTGLLTPRAFRQRLAALVDGARFDRRARLALLFVDTDRFKEWNDAYGHASGDLLLREIAQVLRGAATSERDLAARNGGDEFCLVLTAVGKADAIERADLLRGRIAALDVRGLHQASARAEVRITASIGVAALWADAATANELLERADAAMYHAKQTGRDGVSYLTVRGELTRLEVPERLAAMSNVGPDVPERSRTAR